MIKSLTINDSGMEPTHGFHSLDHALGIYKHSERVLTNWNPLTARLDAFKCTKSTFERIYIHYIHSRTFESVSMHSIRVWRRLNALSVRLNAVESTSCAFQHSCVYSVCVWSHLYAHGTHLERICMYSVRVSTQFWTLTFSSPPPVHVFVVQVVGPIVEHQPVGPWSKFTESNWQTCK